MQAEIKDFSRNSAETGERDEGLTEMMQFLIEFKSKSKIMPQEKIKQDVYYAIS